MSDLPMTNASTLPLGEKLIGHGMVYGIRWPYGVCLSCGSRLVNIETGEGHGQHDDDRLTPTGAPTDEPRTHHIDRVTHSGGPKSGHWQYQCDCGFESPFGDIDDRNAALHAFTHANRVIAEAYARLSGQRDDHA